MTVCSLGHIPGGHITNHLYSWVDPQGRSVSPPPDPGEANHVHGAGVEERTVGESLHLNTAQTDAPSPLCCCWDDWTKTSLEACFSLLFW